MAVALLAGCATAQPGAPSGSADPTTAPSTPVPSAPGAPSAAGLLTTGHPVTVLDDGDGAELCLGGVATSLPPQCGGPKLVGWDWREHDSAYESQNGVRWGEFVVAGAYDAENEEFTAGEVTPAAEYDPPDEVEPPSPDFVTPCAEPEGGWRVIDESLVSPEAMQAAFERAQTLDGYGVAWMDQSPNPASERELTDPEVESLLNDPALTIVNVAVTHDLPAAEAALREVWSGMLCVSQAERTEAELVAIQQELHEDATGDILSTGIAGADLVLEISVVFDDGTLQDELDARYGEGVVRVHSALAPA